MKLFILIHLAIWFLSPSTGFLCFVHFVSIRLVLVGTETLLRSPMALELLVWVVAVAVVVVVLFAVAAAAVVSL